MSEEINMDWSRFETALQRRLATSSRDHLAVLSEQARGIQRRVIEVTPPGSEGVKGTSRKAREMGMAAVGRDIRRIYGTPGDAYELIRAKNEQVAGAFWKAHQQRDVAEASRLMESVVGKKLFPFDGGKLHGSFKKKQGRVKSRGAIFFVEDEKELNDYIKTRQKRVQFLQAGWKEAASKLGLTLPSSISTHHSVGSAVIEVTATRIRIVATNGVSYASNADVERRIQFAINAQGGAMERQMERYVETLNRRAGL
jgi:hypothetical protein